MMTWAWPAGLSMVNFFFFFRVSQGSKIAGQIFWPQSRVEVQRLWKWHPLVSVLVLDNNSKTFSTYNYRALYYVLFVSELLSSNIVSLHAYHVLCRYPDIVNSQTLPALWKWLKAPTIEEQSKYQPQTSLWQSLWLKYYACSFADTGCSEAYRALQEAAFVYGRARTRLPLDYGWALHHLAVAKGLVGHVLGGPTIKVGVASCGGRGQYQNGMALPPRAGYEDKFTRYRVACVMF